MTFDTHMHFRFIPVLAELNLVGFDSCPTAVSIHNPIDTKLGRAMDVAIIIAQSTASTTENQALKLGPDVNGRW